MAKTLNQFLEQQAGYLKVKNPDEQKFVDKHVVVKHPDRNGNGDEVFNGSKVKKIDRRKENHGYNPGEDEKVYEELKGNQHKIDANKNGKVDAHDFKLLRKKKKVAEEAEQIDEILDTPEKVADYKAKAQKSFSKNVWKGGEKAHRTSTKRLYGLSHPKVANEEAEQIDEISKKLAIKTYAKRNADAFDRDDFKIGSGDREYDKRDRTGARIEKKFGKKTLHKAIGAAHKEIFGEEAEQIDELSTPTLQSYRKKARAQGNAIVDKMKMGGGDWSKDQKDTKTLRKRAAGANMSGKQLVKRGESLKTEEVEELDELSKATLGSYAKKAKDQMSRSDTIAGREMGSRYDGQHPSPNERKHNQRADKRYRGLDMAISKLAKEEAEQIDEISAATKDSYAKKAVKQLPGLFNKSGKDADAARKYYNRKNTVRKIANEEVEQVDEKINLKKASMGTVVKDFQKSDAPQFKGKSQEKRRVMAIAAKLTAERGGKPLRKEERLAQILTDLSESHKNTMLSVFNKLNEDNQKKFLQACETEGGIERMLDFSISHRGE